MDSGKIKKGAMVLETYNFSHLVDFFFRDVFSTVSLVAFNFVFLLNQFSKVELKSLQETKKLHATPSFSCTNKAKKNNLQIVNIRQRNREKKKDKKQPPSITVRANKEN
uniref:(northern house mosquito) hypothetical protein n=1 Tax=Culex pipiens TaxID=7175 RepID=A0A8D8DSH6_CULPI